MPHDADVKKSGEPGDRHGAYYGQRMSVDTFKFSTPRMAGGSPGADGTVLHCAHGVASVNSGLELAISLVRYGCGDRFSVSLALRCST